MKNLVILGLFVFVFSLSVKAQDDPLLKAGKATKEATVTGAKATGKGLKKSGSFVKKVGQKTWGVTKKAVKKIT